MSYFSIRTPCWFFPSLHKLARPYKDVKAHIAQTNRAVMSSKEICWMSALELSKAIKSGELSSVEIIDALIKRIKEHNPKINAIVTLAEGKARRSAKEVEKALKKGKELGPLSGVPLTVKDSESTKGIRTTFGSKLFENNVPEEDTIVVERAKKAGAVILGKTNTPEFSIIAVTDNLLFGHARNP